MKVLKTSLIYLLVSFVLVACSSNPIPKPRGYFRIELKDKDYITYQSDCPVELEIPVYSKIELFPSESTDSCWFNLYFPRHKARIHLTYLSIHGDLDKYLEDAYQFAFKHEMKANAIKSKSVSFPEKQVNGLVYELTGNVASPLQFYVTDSAHHFLRGALYFNHKPNPDSIAPVLDYLTDDVIHLMETINWRDGE
jgi:gliding motility-associated lipoprotein GldD